MATLVVAAATLVTTGCLEPGPPQPVVPPPVITSITAPATLVAGTELVIDVRATHELGIASAGVILMTGPTGTALPYHHECGDPLAQASTGTAPDGAVEIRCTMPSFATNGRWTAEVLVTNRGWTAATGTVSFDVVGGSEDREGPEVVAVAAPPSQVAPGQTFPIVVRVTDPHPPFDVAPPVFTRQAGWLGESGSFECGPVTQVPVSATTVEMSLSCAVPSGQLVGTYWGSVIPTDDLGFLGAIGFMIVVG